MPNRKQPSEQPSNQAGEQPPPGDAPRTRPKRRKRAPQRAPHTPRAKRLRASAAARAAATGSAPEATPQRTRAGVRTYPYVLRGRVTAAILNCPGCGQPMRYRATTGYWRRCPNPECRELWAVGLVVRKAANFGPHGRPADTLVAGSPVEMLDPPGELIPSANQSVEAFPLAVLDTAWKPRSEPLSVLVAEPVIATAAGWKTAAAAGEASGPAGEAASGEAATSTSTSAAATQPANRPESALPSAGIFIAEEA